MSLTTKELEDILNGIFDKENTTHLAIHVDAMVTFAEKIDRPLHNVADLREILALRLEVEGLQEQIATLTNQVTVLKDKCGEPESYKCVVYDMTPGETFAKVRQKLIEIGWTPPQGE